VARNLASSRFRVHVRGSRNGSSGMVACPSEASIFAWGGGDWVPCAFSLLGSFGVECDWAFVGAPCVLGFCGAWLVVARRVAPSSPVRAKRVPGVGASGSRGSGGGVCVCVWNWVPCALGFVLIWRIQREMR